MKGSALALLSVAFSLAAFFFVGSLGFFYLLAAIYTLVRAILQKGRPTFLLLAIALVVLGCLYHPDGLPTFLQMYGVASEPFFMFYRFHIAGCAVLAIMMIFVFASTRLSGGIWLSFLEIGDDIASFQAAFVIIAGLLLLFLLLLLSAPDASLSFINWSLSALNGPELERAKVAINPDWLASRLAFLILLLSLGFGYRKNTMIRNGNARMRITINQQAVIEILACLFVLLPLCGFFIVLFATHTNQASVSTPLLAWLLSGADNGPLPISWQWVVTILAVLGFLSLALSALAVLLRSCVYLFGPQYLQKPAASHLAPSLNMNGLEQGV